jgi:hypothetical protein
MGKKKTAILYSAEVLKKKNTKELLGYLKALQQCEESFELSDMDINDPTGADLRTLADMQPSNVCWLSVRQIIKEPCAKHRYAAALCSAAYQH